MRAVHAGQLYLSATSRRTHGAGGGCPPAGIPDPRARDLRQLAQAAGRRHRTAAEPERQDGQPPVADPQLGRHPAALVHAALRRN